MTQEEKKALMDAFRKAVDFEKRFGYRTDVPELYTNWYDVIDLLEKQWAKKKPKA